MFNATSAEVSKQGFDARFRRMWNLYLTSCAGAFEGGNCDVTQITITRPQDVTDGGAIDRRTEMPTAAKLAAAALFAIIGFIGVQLYLPHLPQELPVGVLRESAAVLGIIIGWRVMGRLAGHGYTDAFGSGIRTAVTLAFWALLFLSIHLMIKRAFKMMYDGPVEAVVGVFALMLDYGRALIAMDVLAWLFIGGALAGLVVEWVGKRWR